jgi:hypothetical protein
MTPDRSQAGVMLTLRDVTYSFDEAPKFVRHAVALANQKYADGTTNMDAAPKFIQHKIELLAKRYGRITSPTS